MVKLRQGRISARTVNRLSVEDREAVYWDSELPGFGVRVYPSGAKVYIVQTRAGGRSRRFTLGRHGLISADEARRRAAQVIVRVKQGEEPEIAASGWAVDPARAGQRRAARAAAPYRGAMHDRILSGIVRRYDRPLMTDDHRRDYVVCMVAELLGPDWTAPRERGYELAPWDLDHLSGARMEIGQSARRRPRDAGRAHLSGSTWFRIAALDEYWTEDGTLEPSPGRLVDIHVLAWHEEGRETLADHRAPEQWKFFVLPSKRLRVRQRSIGLLEVEEMTRAIGFESLAIAVQQVLESTE